MNGATLMAVAMNSVTPIREWSSGVGNRTCDPQIGNQEVDDFMGHI